MKKCKTKMGSIDSIESFGLVDGPGIRTVIFLNGCKLRCKYCHNPEMWTKKENNISPQEIVEKVKRFKPYYKDTGGVTFSGGEPLLQPEFLEETCKLLKQEKINIALDTAGVGIGNYDNILKYVDLVLFDVKHTDHEQYKDLTGSSIEESEKFIKALNKSKVKVWIRQVIVPGLMNNEKYITSLVKYLKKIDNIERVDFLPFHRLGREKYLKLNIPYPYENLNDEDQKECEELYNLFQKKYKSSNK